MNSTGWINLKIYGLHEISMKVALCNSCMNFHHKKCLDNGMIQYVQTRVNPITYTLNNSVYKAYLKQ